MKMKYNKLSFHHFHLFDIFLKFEIFQFLNNEVVQSCCVKPNISSIWVQASTILPRRLGWTANRSVGVSYFSTTSK